MTIEIPRSVAIVGRPNVGKSRLFNRMLGKRLSIVHDMPGVTRDIISEIIPDNILLMDTGGIGADPSIATKIIADATDEKVDFAINAAGLILFVVDSIQGLTAFDEMLAKKLRQYNKKTMLVVNKVDTVMHKQKVDEFFKLGFADVIGVSAEHGLNFERLMEKVQNFFGPSPVVVKKEERIKISLVGRPNVGKSSIGNALLSSDRLIVSEIEGTTRDSVYVDIDYTKAGKDWKFRFFDTAGLKQKRKINTSLDYFSSVRSRKAVDDSDVVFLVLDAKNGVCKVDKNLAGDVLETGCGLGVIVNKWDLAIDAFKNGTVEGYTCEKEFKMHFEDELSNELFFLPDSPIVFASALENLHIKAILKKAINIYESIHQDIGTGKLNQTILKIIEKNPPKYVGGKKFKIYYAVQVSKKPFTIRVFCNIAKRLTDSYKKYLLTNLTEELGLIGVKIHLDLVGKDRTVEEKPVFLKPIKAPSNIKGNVSKGKKTSLASRTTMQKHLLKNKKKRVAAAKARAKSNFKK